MHLSCKQALQMIGHETNQPIKQLNQMVVITNSPHNLLTTQTGSLAHDYPSHHQMNSVTRNQLTK
jgi:hypothetical protein